MDPELTDEAFKFLSLDDITYALIKTKVLQGTEVETRKYISAHAIVFDKILAGELLKNVRIIERIKFFYDVSKAISTDDYMFLYGEAFGWQDLLDETYFTDIDKIKPTTDTIDLYKYYLGYAGVHTDYQVIFHGFENPLEYIASLIDGLSEEERLKVSFNLNASNGMDLNDYKFSFMKDFVFHREKSKNFSGIKGIMQIYVPDDGIDVLDSSLVKLAENYRMKMKKIGTVSSKPVLNSKADKRNKHEKIKKLIKNSAKFAGYLLYALLCLCLVGYSLIGVYYGSIPITFIASTFLSGLLIGGGVIVLFERR